jgi:hypothetical protein
MKVRSIRRITDDGHHNAFTGACWFKGDLYVGYRQGDDHAGDMGRIIIRRSRDKGITFDTVAVFCGNGDTRDASLHTDGNRLYAVAHVEATDDTPKQSGTAHTADGDHWTAWTPFEGADGYCLWRPVWYNGKHYCAGYSRLTKNFGVHWFESDDCLKWEDVRVVHESEIDRPNECYLEILPDGTATMIMRCEGGTIPKHPYLCRSKFPFESWDMQKLEDLSLTGPALWTVDDRVYISGRWNPMTTPGYDDRVKEEGGFAHTAIFRVLDGKTYLLCVLPSGPKPDHSYMGVARWPDNRYRFSLSFYANAIASADPSLDQWTHPDVYVADVHFGTEAEFIEELLVSDPVETATGLIDATLPNPQSNDLTFHSVPANKDDSFIDVQQTIRGHKGIVYFVKDIEVGPWDHVNVLLGYDGPVKVWWNGTEVFQGPAHHPAEPDQTSLSLDSKHGTNRLAIALDITAGTASGIFARWKHA